MTILFFPFRQLGHKNPQYVKFCIDVCGAFPHMMLIPQLQRNVTVQNKVSFSYVLPSPRLIPSLFAETGMTGRGGLSGSFPSALNTASMSLGSYTWISVTGPIFSLWILPNCLNRSFLAMYNLSKLYLPGRSRQVSIKRSSCLIVNHHLNPTQMKVDCFFVMRYAIQ